MSVTLYERKIREQDLKTMLLRLLNDWSLQNGLLRTTVSLDSIFLHLYVFYHPLAGRQSQVNLFLQILQSAEETRGKIFL